jgi:MATE family multidrug resistance protein
LLGWVMLFHIGDAAQTIAAATLRAHRIATLPMIIYAGASWGVGLGGGFAIAFDSTGLSPEGLLGAQGFWAAATVGVALTSLAFCAVLVWQMRRETQRVAMAPA